MKPEEPSRTIRSSNGIWELGMGTVAQQTTSHTRFPLASVSKSVQCSEPAAGVAMTAIIGKGRNTGDLSGTGW
jgi:hypothetical protein